MKPNRIAQALTALTLLAAALVGLQAPASAHNWDNYSAWYCAKHRSEPQHEYTIVHSWPDSLTEDLVRYRCIEARIDNGVRYGVWVYVNTPVTSGDSFLLSYWQRCYPYNGWTTVCPIHP